MGQSAFRQGRQTSVLRSAARFGPRRAHFLPFFERRLSLLTVGVSPTDSFRPASSYLLLVRSRNDVTRFESYHKTLCERFSSKPLHGFDTAHKKLKDLANSTRHVCCKTRGRFR